MLKCEHTPFKLSWGIIVCRWCRNPLGNCTPTNPQPDYYKVRGEKRTSVYPGVYYDSTATRWKGCLYIDRKTHVTNGKPTELEAAIALNKLALKLGMYHRILALPSQAR